MHWTLLDYPLGGEIADIPEYPQNSKLPYFDVEGVEENWRLDPVMTGNCGNPGGTSLIGGLQACTNVHKRANARASPFFVGGEEMQY